MTTARCRIARTAADAYALPAGAAAPDSGSFKRLHGLIRHYLSPATASVLAEPVPTADGGQLDWFTPLGGQPERFTELPESEQPRVRRLLDIRLEAIRELARRLPEFDPECTDAPALLQATAYPGDEAVYVVGGQPVVTFWAYGVLPRFEPEADAAASQPGRRARWPVVVATVPLLLGVAGWAAFHFSLLRWPPWGPDYVALLKAERAEGERLRRELIERHSALAAHLGHCALQDQVATLQRERALLAERRDELAAQLGRLIQSCKTQ
ncbi:MAG: hypothetical protein FJ189_11485 [Gammaproteobacteria bacterium]|nr:hypothetical protein [Gammaproteobacteria bacterium]